ncbi:MAG TPA: DUF4139 domain-containing protein [Planctomycetota bacterium]
MKIAAAALVLALPLMAQDVGKKDSQLAVKKIVVYKHGVGYFEREGKVKDNQKVVLAFKSAQMKDLLKSLYAVDLDGGRVAAISYDTKDPLSKQLEDILIRVPEQNALTQFLMQLKGARVEVTIGGETIVGSVVGIEPVVRQTPSGNTTSYKLVLFRDDGKIQPVDLLEMSGLRLLDEGLQKDLKRLLDITLKSKYSDRKSVVLDTQGNGERTVRVGYIIETPIWKTSYRLLFQDGQKPLLQGWAILENTTDEDWDNVDVSFVAGSPMSFVMDLYTAYYPERHEIPVGVTAAPKPMDALARAPQAPAPGGAANRMRGMEKKDKAADEEREFAAAPARKAATLAEALENAVVPAAEGVEVGDLFAYQSKEKVSVKRGQAALVPILSERLETADRVLYWRPGAGDRPLNSAYLKNATALTLEAGPVTVFDGSTCVGEGLLRRVLKKDMKEMISFAVEAGVTVETKVNHRNDPVTRGRIANGVLTLTHTQNLETVYALKNQLAKDVVLHLDHARHGGFTLAEPAKPDEEPLGQYRFRIELKTGGALEHRIRETQPVSTTVALIQTPAETIRYYATQRYLSDVAKKFLADLAQTQGEINRLRQEEAELNQERARLGEDDARIRQNLGVLRADAAELEMRRKYLTRLQDSDTRQEQIKGLLKEKGQQRAALERELAKKVQEFRED